MRSVQKRTRFKFIFLADDIIVYSVFITRDQTRSPRRRHTVATNSSAAAVFAVWARRTLWRAVDATNGALCERFAASRKRARVVWSGRGRPVALSPLSRASESTRVPVVRHYTYYYI